MTTSDSFEDLGRLADELAEAVDVPGAEGDDADAGRVRRAAAALAAVIAFAPDEIDAVLDAEGEPPIPPPDLPDDYEVLGEIGRGGMGVVYRARQRSLDRTVAVKVLRPGDLLFGQAMKRFEREARALARLRHRHIVAIHEVGESEGRVWFSMDCIEGRSMDELVRDRRMTPSRVVKLLKQVTSAVSYVHSHGLVHRDLKPANILVDEHGDAVVTDFGLALEVGSADGLTMTGQILGTPAYMSPEQARGDTAAIGEATDVYALGAVLYECLTGQRPFEGESPAMQVWSVLHKDPAPPRRIDKRVPEDLEVICLKAMRKQPEDRYPTARALLEDLERFEEGRAIRAQPPTRAYRIGRFVRRHRAPILWAGGVLAVAVALFAYVIAPRLLRNVDPLLEAAAALRGAGDAEGAVHVYERAIALSQEKPSRDLYARLTAARLEAAQKAWARGGAEEAVALLGPALAEGHALFGEGDDPSMWIDAGPVEWAYATSLALEGNWREGEPRFRSALRSWDAALGRAGRRDGDPDAAARLALEPALPALADPSDPLHGAARVQARGLAGAGLDWAEAYLELLRPRPGAAEPWRLVVPLADTLAREVGEEDPHRLDEFVVAARGLAAPGLERELVAVLEADEALPSVRHLQGALLADLADLPVRIAFGPVLHEDLEYYLSHLLEAWRGSRDLPRAEALRWRIARAFETWGQIADERRGAEGLADHRAFLALRDLQMWMAHRTGHREFPERPAMDAFFAEHGSGDPRRWLTSALGLGAEPAGTSNAKLLIRLRTAAAHERPWIHFLLALRAPPEVHVPVWGTRWVGQDVLPEWRRRLGVTPEYTHARMATFADGPDGWRIVGSDLQPIDDDMRVDLNYEAPFAPEPFVATAMTFPGLPAQAAEAPVRTHDIEGVLAWDEYGLEYQLQRTMAQHGRGRSSSSGGSASVSAAYVFSPDLKVGGWSDPDPFRKQLTLMAFEIGPGGSGVVGRPAWDDRRRRDLDDLATKAASFVDDAPLRSGANRFLLAQQRTLSNVLGTATWLPLPEAKDELRRLEATLLEDGNLDHQPRLALLARLAAGDDRALDAPDFEARLAAMQPHGIALTTAGRDGEYWVRLLRHGTSPRIRALAIARLESSTISARAAGDLLDVWRAGAVEIPESLRERLRRGPTQDRTWWGLVKANWGWSGFAGSVLLIGLLLFLRVVWPGLRVDQRLVSAAWLVAFGLLTACVSIFVAGVDLLPATLGYAWAALGVWVLAKEAGAPDRVRTTLLLAFAAAFSVRSLFATSGEVELALAGLACFVAFAGLPRLIRTLRAEPRARWRWPWPFLLFYVLPIGLVYVALGVAIVAGAEVHVSVGGILGMIFLLGVTVCVLWALISLLHAAGIRKAWLRSRRVKDA